jgi:hypothetical protein
MVGLIIDKSLQNWESSPAPTAQCLSQREVFVLTSIFLTEKKQLISGLAFQNQLIVVISSFSVVRCLPSLIEQ